MKQENKFREHIFVFGSNLLVRHGRGSQLYLQKNNYGAVYGVGVVQNWFHIMVYQQKILIYQHYLLMKLKNMLMILFCMPKTIQIYFQVTNIGCVVQLDTIQNKLSMFIDSPSNCFFNEKTGRNK